MEIPLLKPPKLHQGDTIGIVAPSLPILPEFGENYRRGKRILTEMGFKLKEGKTIQLTHWWSAGTAEEQARDINSMFADTEVKAIIAQTGGHSAITVLEHIDYSLIIKHPKPFIGMSDITVFHLAFFAKTGLVGFHMDDVTFGFGSDNRDEQSLDRKVFQDIFLNPSRSYQQPVFTTWESWCDGKARGRLIGGNLHLLANQIGTPYFPPLSWFDGAILFWEDVGEPLYAIARSLYQLKYAGIFNKLSGMIIGTITDIKHMEEKSIVEPNAKELVLSVMKEYTFPILAHVDFGHYTVNIPMPVGIEAEFDAKAKVFKLLESPVEF